MSLVRYPVPQFKTNYRRVSQPVGGLTIAPEVVQDVLVNTAQSTQTAVHAEIEAVVNSATSTQVVADAVLVYETALQNVAVAAQAITSAETDIIHNRGPPSPVSTQTLAEAGVAIDTVDNTQTSTQLEVAALGEVILAPGAPVITESVMETL